MSRLSKCMMILMLYSCIPLLAVFSLSDSVQNIIAVIISCVACVIACRVFKERIALDIRKKQVAVLMTAFAVIAVTAYMLSGIYFGFSKVVLLGSLIFTQVLPIIIIIASTEILLYVLISQEIRLVSILSLLIFTAAEIFVISHEEGGEGIVQMICLIAIPALLSNVLHHYVVEKFGALPNILYGTIIACYPFFIPIRPQMPTAVFAAVRIFWPLFVLFFIYKLYEKRRRKGSKKHNKMKSAGNVFLLLLCTSFIMLVAGVGKYKMLVIGSESMSGVMDKGDAVIYEKYTDQSIREGQIILFERDGIIIVHRVTDIERVDGLVRYYTKGDANDTADVGYTDESHIVGISSLRVRYIGYPAVWARDL